MNICREFGFYKFKLLYMRLLHMVAWKVQAASSGMKY